MSKPVEYLRRSLLPRAVIATGEAGWAQRTRVSLRRSLGGRASIELYFAFDDPYSAIALPPLMDMAMRRDVELQLYPLVERGIPDDPAGGLRRQHAVSDSGWLARRGGRRLARNSVIDPQQTAFLAAWAESARGNANMAVFAATVLERLWFHWNGEIRPEDFLPLYRIYLCCDPPSKLEFWQAKVQANSRRMQRKGHWESPAARVEGQWFFAHERIAQIEAHLLELGW